MLLRDKFRSNSRYQVELIIDEFDFVSLIVDQTLKICLRDCSCCSSFVIAHTHLST